MRYKYKQTILATSMLVLLTILSSCATAPNVCVPSSSQDLPAKVQPGPSFQERMRVFLAGKLPEQTSSEKPSSPATQPGK